MTWVHAMVTGERALQKIRIQRRRPTDPNPIRINRYHTINYNSKLIRVTYAYKNTHTVGTAFG